MRRYTSATQKLGPHLTILVLQFHTLVPGPVRNAGFIVYKLPSQVHYSSHPDRLKQLPKLQESQLTDHVKWCHKELYAGRSVLSILHSINKHSFVKQIFRLTSFTTQYVLHCQDLGVRE